jgi:Asp-tRNA(Asn)/Glu-tRNA(Gln) amidotransferase C subunit
MGHPYHRSFAMPNPIEFDRNTMQHLAELARLHLTADRLPLLRQRLQRLVDAFGALAEPTGPAAGGDDAAGTDLDPGAATSLALRTDLPLPPLPPEQALANAPQQAAGAFLVPRVVDA